LLIVEDEKSVLKVLADKFGGEGFGVFMAEDGEAGLKVAFAEKPDLILLDLIMPKKTGLEMMHELRKDPDYGKKVPIIILTNLSANDKVSGEVSEEEPSYYLVKADWKIEDVVRKVKETLGMIEK